MRLWKVLGAVAAMASGAAVVWSDVEDDRRETAASFQKQLNPCWIGVDDLGPDGQIEVIIGIQLDREGKLVGDPEVLSPAQTPVLAGEAAEAVDRAIRAVARCAPYNLPKETFNMWERVEIILGPRHPVQLTS